MSKKGKCKMPRKMRKISNTKVYHIIFRGNDKLDIFFDEQDYKKVIKEILKYREKYKYEIFAYCLMSNHVHLIIYDKNENISKAMQSIIMSYSIYFGKNMIKLVIYFKKDFIVKMLKQKIIY